MASGNGTYLFTDVLAALTGPGGNFSLSDLAVAEEGIMLERIEDNTEMVIGAGGGGMHTKNASRAGRITITTLYNSPLNTLLSNLYKVQDASSALQGLNTISVANPVLGDSHTGTGCAFRKLPTVRLGRRIGTQEWPFNVIDLELSFGLGLSGQLVNALTAAV